MQTRIQSLVQKGADTTRSVIGFVLDAEAVWGLFVTVGLPLGVLGFVRTTLGWWTSQDILSQFLLGASFLCLLSALGITIWNQWGIGLLRWLQGKAFPVVVFPETVNHDELHLSVRSQYDSDTFKASIDRIPLSTSDPVPAPLPWRASGEETRKIFAGDREDLRFMRFRFVPPSDYANRPAFLWAIDTASGTTFRGGVYLATKDDDGFWVGEQRFLVSVAGWELGVERFTVTVSPRWHEAEDRAGAQLRAAVEPAPQTIFGAEFQAVRNYVRGDPITKLTDEFESIDSLAIPIGMMDESEREGFRMKQESNSTQVDERL